MYAERVPKDFSEALRYYERAALIEPASGNAQNQVTEGAQRFTG
jgi:TPR repeat protein